MRQRHIAHVNKGEYGGRRWDAALAPAAVHEIAQELVCRVERVEARQAARDGAKGVGVVDGGQVEGRGRGARQERPGGALGECLGRY